MFNTSYSPAAASTSWRGDVLALISGAILPLAFSPFDLSLVALLAPADAWASLAPSLRRPVSAGLRVELLSVGEAELDFVPVRAPHGQRTWLIEEKTVAAMYMNNRAAEALVRGELDTAERVAGMGLMGLGGLISIVGGFLFIYICYRAIWHGRAQPAP